MSRTTRVLQTRVLFKLFPGEIQYDRFLEEGFPELFWFSRLSVAAFILEPLQNKYLLSYSGFDTAWTVKKERRASQSYSDDDKNQGWYIRFHRRYSFSSFVISLAIGQRFFSSNAEGTPNTADAERGLSPVFPTNPQINICAVSHSGAQKTLALWLFEGRSPCYPWRPRPLKVHASFRCHWLPVGGRRSLL